MSEANKVIGLRIIEVDGVEHLVTVFAPHIPRPVEKEVQGRANKAMVRQISFGGIIGNGKRVWAPTLDETERKMK